MSLLAFLFRTLIVSVSVGVRMMPVLGVTFYSIYMVVLALGNHVLAIFASAVILYLPLLMFLTLCAVRAGLASLRATTAPDFKKLAIGSLRLMRFHFMIGNLVFTLVGLGGVGAILWFTAPGLIELLTNIGSLAGVLDIPALAASLTEIPAIALVVIPFAIAIAVGLVGTSLGGTAAWAAERGPEHDLIWGVTNQFRYIFSTALIVLVLPALLVVFYIGGPFASAMGLIFLGKPLLSAIGLYALWAICALAAAMAVAYVKNIEDIEKRRVADEMSLMGRALDTSDVRALRQSRQARQTVITQ